MSLRSCVLVSVIFAACTVAQAQTGVDLLLRPLVNEKETVEVRGDAYFFNQGTTDNSSPFQMSLYESSGRFREQRENLIPRIGYELKYYDLDTTNPTLPGQLLDTSIAAGLELGTYSGWRAGFTFGLGYAGDVPFAQSDAWYGKATLLVGKDLDPKTTLAFVLDYDGLCTYMPDVPLPGIELRHQFDPTLSYTIGFPLTEGQWKPDEKLTVRGTFLVLDRLGAEVEYGLSKQWKVYGRYLMIQQAFHTEQIPGNNRLLFEQSRTEAGVRYKPGFDTTFTAALGYGFSGSFDEGFDTRDSTHITDISDEPYFRIAFETRF